MLCRNPFVSNGGLGFGCGQCMACRYNRRRVWMHRIMLEAAQYSDNAFLTLTYADEVLPEGGTLVPSHPQLFLKRLRARVAPSRFRFFLVGEYGDASGRPHYHAALFGFPTCVNGDTRLGCHRKPCYWCALVRETWKFGNIMLGKLEDNSAGYMAGYVTKKMTSPSDPRLNGRHPEFGRMSLRPGIGHDALWEIADTLLKYELDQELADVPLALQHGLKKLPLGRYLRRHLRKYIGRDEKISQESFDALAAEVLELRLAAKADANNPSVKAKLIEAGEGRFASMVARNKIYQKGKTL